MLHGVPIRPNRKSLSAKFRTPKLTYLNLPVSCFLVETYKTSPFPTILIKPPIELKMTENQNAIQLA